MQRTAFINNTLNESGLQVHDIDGRDGNCQPRAVAYMLGLGEDKHFFVRQILVTYIRNHARSFKRRFPDIAIEDYCDRMQQSGEWGDDLLLLAAVEVFSLKIVLIQSTGQEIQLQIETAQITDTIHLIYYPGLHYDATDPLDGPNLEALGPREQNSFPLDPWELGRIDREIRMNDNFTQRILCMYMVHSSGTDVDLFTHDLISWLKNNISSNIGRLNRLFAYAEGPDALFIEIWIKYAIQNRRSTFEKLFQMREGQNQTFCPSRIFEVDGWPHPDFIEWNIQEDNIIEPLSTWNHIDGRSTKPKKKLQQKSHSVQPGEEGALVNDAAPRAHCPFCKRMLPFNFLEIPSVDANTDHASHQDLLSYLELCIDSSDDMDESD